MRSLSGVQAQPPAFSPRPSLPQVGLGLCGAKYAAAAFVLLSENVLRDRGAPMLNGPLVECLSVFIYSSVFSIARAAAIIQQAVQLVGPW